MLWSLDGCFFVDDSWVVRSSPSQQELILKYIIFCCRELSHGEGKEWVLQSLQNTNVAAEGNATRSEQMFCFLFLSAGRFTSIQPAA